MVTDLEEVRRLGTSKLAENLDFRRHLAAHHIPDEPFHKIAWEIQQHIDCTTCANCCRCSTVTVSKSEIAAIARHLGSTYDEALHQYTARDPDDSERTVLKSTPEGCVFLHRNLCTIYEVRPKPCRDFPHVAPGSHSLGGRLSSHARWAALCPIIYNALEAYKHAVGYHPRH